jgi:hypothetical protein
LLFDPFGLGVGLDLGVNVIGGSPGSVVLGCLQMVDPGFGDDLSGVQKAIFRGDEVSGGLG